MPSLIILNLFFGLLFFKPRHWLIIEAVLVLLFLLNTYIFTRKVVSDFPRKHSDVIDVEGKVVDETRRKT